MTPLTTKKSGALAAEEAAPTSARPTSWAALPLALSVAEAAKVLGIGRNGCYALVARGQLSGVRIGRRLVIPRQAVEQFLAAEPTADAAPRPLSALER
jgi:excisionase family DNA binding protein